MKVKQFGIKKYYRITFEIISPLSIGNGVNEITDNDIILNSRGLPYIPGSALAGVYRSLFEKETSDKYFGKDMTEEMIQEMAEQGKNLLTESKVIVYDAEILNPEKRNVAVYDMVALDEYKVAISGAKFDFQVLEPGIQFVTYIEQNMDNMKEEYLTEEIVYAWKTGKIWLGAKNGRGYGQTKIIKIEHIVFDFSKDCRKQSRCDGDDWIEFDMYEDSWWKETKENKCLSRVSIEDVQYQELQSLYQEFGIALCRKETIGITLRLKQCGGISVRQYSSNINDADYRQMSRKDKEKDKREVFIPGTTWAGAFRAQMGKLDFAFAKKEPMTELFFGKVKEKGEDSALSHKTRVTFSESRIDEGEWRIYTRNSIDRFSGGTIDGALYTEETYFNGKTELDISCDMTGIDKKNIRHFCSVLAAAILDLNYGYMAVGGLTAVGHGLFEVTGIKVNGNEVPWAELKENEQYLTLRDVMEKSGL